jgi:UDP:flavonoid glycosyltransferase YjiC (YdhE family)
VAQPHDLPGRARLCPIFWDQHDNAQRVHETGYGLRLPTYSLREDALIAALDRLLTDADLRARAAAAGAGLRQRPGTAAAVDLIERPAITGQPILS